MNQLSLSLRKHQEIDSFRVRVEQSIKQAYYEKIMIQQAKVQETKMKRSASTVLNVEVF